MPKTLSTEEIKKKIEHYCAYQERCVFEVRKKLIQLGADENVIVAMLQWLTNENFINEQRFAEAYARSKINQKNWGKNKIVIALKSFGIAENIINIAFSKVDANIYNQQLIHSLEKKNKTIQEPNTFIRKNKLAQYLINKGFEADLVWEKINKMIND